MEIEFTSLRLDDRRLRNSTLIKAEYELCPRVHNLFLTPTKLLRCREAIIRSDEGSLIANAWECNLKRARIALRADIALDMAPYCGDDVALFQNAAQRAFNPMLFMSLIGAVTGDLSFIHHAKTILISWASAVPLPGTHLVLCKKKKGGISLAGLIISRFMDRVAESFRILASSMDARERSDVLLWIQALGGTVRTSHEFWLAYHKGQGPSNHHAWHAFGMALSGCMTNDAAMIDYALKERSNTWNFANMVKWAIHDNSRSTNLFKEGCNSKGRQYSFGGIANDGEIFDRFRTLCEDKPPCGLHYALLSLHGLVYCAHLIVSNNLNFSDDIHQSTPYDLYGSALVRALHMYGQFFVDFPTRSRNAETSLEPYRGLQPDKNALAAYIISLEQLPHDQIISDVVRTNFPKHKTISDNNMSKMCSADDRYVVMQRPHPIATPLCFLVLLNAYPLEILNQEKEFRAEDLVNVSCCTHAR